MLYADDLVDAFNRFIKSDLKRGLFNIGGGQDNTISLLEFIDDLESLTGKRPKVKFSDWRPSDQKVYISDTTKVTGALNWRPRVSPVEGVGLLIEWVKKNKELFE